MRGLLKASLLLAPALAASFVVPSLKDATENDRVVTDRSFAYIGVESPSSHGDSETLAFRLDVLPSENACGLASVTIDDQVLPQTIDGEFTTGEGSVTLERKNVIVASWSFQCIKVNGQPDSQLLKFVVDLVDGKAVEDAGFSALFRQTGSTEIINISTDLSLPGEEVANHNPESLQRAGHEDHDFPQFSIEEEMEELHWLRAQQRELEFLIWSKERAIAEHVPAHFEEDIQECDSLKCVAKAVVDKARKAASHMMNKVHIPHGEHEHGHGHGFEEEEAGRFPKHKPGHKQHGNHTCGPPKHGNHTAPPHWKKPHHRLLPICRYPPPPPHGGPPGKHHDHPPPPPPHGPPKNGNFPPPPPEPHHGFPEDDNIPPTPGSHGEFLYDGPEDHHQGRPDHEMGPPSEGHHGPPHDDMRPHDGPFDGPRGPPHHEEEHFDGPHHHDSPHDAPHDGPHDGPHGPPHNEEPHGPPDFDGEAPFALFDSEPGPPGPPGPPFSGPRPHHSGLGKAFHVTKFVTIGVLISLLIAALHRRACTSKRSDRQARRSERHRRRAFRRAAHKHAISRFFARLSGHDEEEDSDYEEKRQALLSDAEDGMSTTMTEEITELRNAADVVDELVTESRRSHPIAVPTPSTSISGSENRSLLSERDYDFGSQVGDGEELPAYEDNDGSEMSSVVADGFRYTPGSTEYSPSLLGDGSASDILGPDTKQ